MCVCIDIYMIYTDAMYTKLNEPRVAGQKS